MNKDLVNQFIKYFGAALVGYAVDFSTLIICKEILHLHYLISATAGFILGLLVVYIVSNRYVFGESKLKSKSQEFLLFALVGLVGLGILNLIMWGLTSGMHINYLVSKILATIVVYGWNFFARRGLYHN
jgi:putative flippase GtrA